MDAVQYIGASKTPVSTKYFFQYIASRTSWLNRSHKKKKIGIIIRTFSWKFIFMQNRLHQMHTTGIVGLLLRSVLYQFNHKPDVLCTLQRIVPADLCANFNMQMVSICHSNRAFIPNWFVHISIFHLEFTGTRGTVRQWRAAYTIEIIKTQVMHFKD